uniref:GUN4-like domain-containing protein n=1 Tax=Chondria sp. (in: red algae) TaxID=1982705 RepID=A0A1Z1ME80_9FLOR|nr:hypothetical protein [Chondria sp. (in: red algae)]
MNNLTSEYTNMSDKLRTIASKNFINITNDTEKTIDLIYKNNPEILLDFIIERILVNKQDADILDGFIFQKLLHTDITNINQKLNKYFPNGIAKQRTSLEASYQNLQNLLMNEAFEEADKITSKYLCELVEIQTNNKKNWLYFTDIQFITSKDLFAIDSLWKIYSKGNFGFSVQKQIWIQNSKNWDKVWEKINWTINGKMKRYPHEFMWTLEAPKGHLPLSNQLRGTKTLLYVFNKITWY